MVVGDISDSFSMLQSSVSRGSWGSRCTSGSKTARTGRDTTRERLPVPAYVAGRTRRRNTASQVRTVAARATPVSKHRSRRSRRSRGTGAAGSHSSWRRRRGVHARQENTYGALGSLEVFTVTGVPRREPCRPYGRTVSPERELHELSMLPWRSTVVSFLVMVAAGSAALPDAMRLRVVGVGAAVRAAMAAGVVVEAACAGGPRTADAVTMCTWGGAGRERG